jgi:ribonuclease Z
MSQLTILGSSNAIPSLNHENTHMVLAENDGLILIDCPGNPIVRLRQAELDPLDLEHLVLTHFHPDHISGAPSLLMQSWLLGREKPMTVHGLGYTLDRLIKILELYEWQSWPGLYPVIFHEIPESEFSPVLETKTLRLLASPVKHMVPTIGLRFEFLMSRKVLAYSCDTEPCQAVVRLAHQADLLIHEATGASNGHSSAAQAGEIASETSARKLALIHYATGSETDPLTLLEEARQTYTGEVILADDFSRFDF